MRAGLIALVGALVALVGATVGCAPVVEADLRADGIVSAILIQVSEAPSRNVLIARVFEPYDPDASFAIGTSTSWTVAMLGYPAPLETYGLQIDDDRNLVLARADGDPLPQPTRWLDLGAEVPHAIEDVAVEWRSDHNPFAGVRVPICPCVRLVELTESRIDFSATTAPTMVAALGPDQALVGLDRSTMTGSSTIAIVATSTSWLVKLPRPLDGWVPRGFGERDGTAWVFAATQRIAGKPGTPYQCHVRGGWPPPPADCQVAEGDNEGLLFERVVGQRLPDGTLEIVAMSWNFALHYWHGDAHDRGIWRRLYTGGVFEKPNCQTGTARVGLLLDGPGTGVASFESGPLERFTVTTTTVTRQLMFDVPSELTSTCRSAYGQSPLGPQLFVRVETIVASNSLLPEPSVNWWRPDASSEWQRLGLDNHFEPQSVFALGDALVVSGQALTATPLVLNPRRPDVPPRPCAATAVFADASQVDRVDDETIILTGSGSDLLSRRGIRTVSRWRVEPVP